MDVERLMACARWRASHRLAFSHPTAIGQCLATSLWAPDAAWARSEIGARPACPAALVGSWRRPVALEVGQGWLKLHLGCPVIAQP